MSTSEPSSDDLPGVEPGACADPDCPVLHEDPSNPIHPPKAGESIADVPVLELDELRAGGYVQEVNRWFFHPLGLALGVLEDRLVVLDGRDDFEGVWFAPDLVDDEMRSKAELVRGEWKGREIVREARLGFMIQPLLADEMEAAGADVVPVPRAVLAALIVATDNENAYWHADWASWISQDLRDAVEGIDVPEGMSP